MSTPVESSRRTTRRLSGAVLEGPVSCKSCEAIFRATWRQMTSAKGALRCLYCGEKKARPVCPGVKGEA